MTEKEKMIPLSIVQGMITFLKHGIPNDKTQNAIDLLEQVATGAIPISTQSSIPVSVVDALMTSVEDFGENYRYHEVIELLEDLKKEAISIPSTVDVINKFEQWLQSYDKNFATDHYNVALQDAFDKLQEIKKEAIPSPDLEQRIKDKIKDKINGWDASLHDPNRFKYYKKGEWKPHKERVLFLIDELRKLLK